MQRRVKTRRTAALRGRLEVGNAGRGPQGAASRCAARCAERPRQPLATAAAAGALLRLRLLLDVELLLRAPQHLRREALLAVERAAQLLQSLCHPRRRAVAAAARAVGVGRGAERLGEVVAARRLESVRAKSGRSERRLRAAPVRRDRHFEGPLAKTAARRRRHCGGWPILRLVRNLDLEIELPRGAIFRPGRLRYSTEPLRRRRRHRGCHRRRCRRCLRRDRPSLDEDLSCDVQHEVLVGS